MDMTVRGRKMNNLGMGQKIVLMKATRIPAASLTSMISTAVREVYPRLDRCLKHLSTWSVKLYG